MCSVVDIFCNVVDIFCNVVDIFCNVVDIFCNVVDISSLPQPNFGPSSMLTLPSYSYHDEGLIYTLATLCLNGTLPLPFHVF